MDCFCIIILVIVVIIFAMFICFCTIGKSNRVSGGHEVKLGDSETLHIENYKELKRVLRKMHPEWKEEEAHAKARKEADIIVNSIIARMDTTLGYHKKAAFIDEEIMKVINSIGKGITE